MTNIQNDSQPQSHLFPTYARFPIKLVKGAGSRLWDDQGNEYIDFMCGLAVTNLGHAPAPVAQRIKAQLDELWHVSNLFHIPGQEELAGLIAKHSCADRVFLCSSGAEANEAAIKLARRYQRKVLGTERYEIITFDKSFHGRTLATLTATGQDKVKEGFAPLPSGFLHVPYNDIEALKAAIGPNTAAVMLEFIQAEGGVHPADKAFIQEIAKLCAEQGLLFIADEVQTGMGRTGTWFAYEQYGVEPDIITLAKGLGSGFPIGAMLGKEKLAGALTAGSHGSTFGGTALACAAAIATIETMEHIAAPEQAGRLGALAVQTLKRELADCPFVTGIRGLGLLIGIECTGPAAPIIEAAQKQGVLAVTAGPNVVRLLPALTIPEEDLLEGLHILTSIIRQHAAQGAAQAIS